MALAQDQTIVSVALVIALAIVLPSCSASGKQADSEGQRSVPAPVGSPSINSSKISVGVKQDLGNAEIPSPKPAVVSRVQWGAKPSIGKGKEHEIKFITLHHTASSQQPRTSLDKKLLGLQRHAQTASKLATGKMKPVWFDIAYHFYIATDGVIAEARELGFVGDTNTNYDPTGHALIVLEGNFETEKPTANQIESTRKLVSWLAAEYKVPKKAIGVHSDHASTLCPGKNLKGEMGNIVDG